MIKMSDRISIDHIHNTITIQINTHDLSQMTNEEILLFVRSFILDINSASLQIGIVGDILPQIFIGKRLRSLSQPGGQGPLWS